jgi:hypothetical protein
MGNLVGFHWNGLFIAAKGGIVDSLPDGLHGASSVP